MDEEDSDQDWDTPKPAKRGKQTGCVIHCTDSNDRLVKPETLESWRSLLAGARRLGNLDILEEVNRITMEKLVRFGITGGAEVSSYLKIPTNLRQR